MEKIYLIKNEENLYKIGVTKRNVNERIKELNISYPYELKIIHEYQTNIGYKLESYLHKIFHHKNIKGEWFELSKNDVEKFISFCKKYENNYKILKESNNPFI